MSAHLIVHLRADDERHLPRPSLPLDGEEARRWLDEQFLALDCEVRRPTGKLLLRDKLLSIAEAAGPAGFDDAAWAGRFAAAVQALGPTLRVIDVPNGRVV